jgi:hypothetical protein
MRPPNIRALVFGFLLMLPPHAAPAKDAPAVPAEQSRVFALGYTLRACDLRAQDYVEAVQALKTLGDGDAATAETVRRSRETPKLRRTQAVAYAQAARLLSRMGAPPAVQTWAAQTAARLDAGLVYDREARDMAKKEPDAGLVLAELNELQEIRVSSDAEQPALAVWLKLTGGGAAIWTADVGSFTADLHRAAAMPGPSRLLGRAALHLLLKAPRETPSGVRGELSELVPSGGGNLKNLATVLPDAVPREKISRVYSGLMGIYVPGKPPEK